MTGMQPSKLAPGDKVQHTHNRELGPGEVKAVTANRLTVHFPKTGDTLQFAAAGHPFEPIKMQPGADPERWMEEFQEDMVERLARLDVEANQIRPVRVFQASSMTFVFGGVWASISDSMDFAILARSSRLIFALEFSRRR